MAGHNLNGAKKLYLLKNKNAAALLVIRAAAFILV
jgi:hypothetical protein